jgi:hypothetical protein
MSRCIACDNRMTKLDFNVDWDMCRHCLGTIEEEIIKLSSQIVEDEEETEEDE